MILQPGKMHHNLTKRIEILDVAYIKIGPQVYENLCNVSVQTIVELYDKEDIPGKPRFIALENGITLITYPRPDKKYHCRVIGVVRIEQ